MNRLIRRFLRALIWCWLPCFAVVLGLLLALGFNGEPLAIGTATTWLALTYALLLAGIVAVAPALMLSVMLAAATFWRASSNPLLERKATPPAQRQR